MQPDKNGRPMCVAEVLCGGFAGVECARDQVCVDYPVHDCVTARGDSDCQGICAPRSFRIQS